MSGRICHGHSLAIHGWTLLKVTLLYGVCLLGIHFEILMLVIVRYTLYPVSISIVSFLILLNAVFILLLLLQGLNYVAALLLLVMKTEEDAFWMLAVLLENMLVRDCYTTNLSGCHVEQRVFKDLLAQKCPR